LKNILFDCGTAYFTYLKSPFTYLEFERQNATCFLEKTENFFEKAVYLKNIPSLVPTGRGHLGIVVPKKGKKICPPDMAGVFVFARRLVYNKSLRRFMHFTFCWRFALP